MAETHLKLITGKNRYCGPCALSAITGESTDEIAAWIRRYRNHLPFMSNHKCNQVRGCQISDYVHYLMCRWDCNTFRYYWRGDDDFPPNYGGSDDPCYYLESWREIEGRWNHVIAVCRGMAADSHNRYPIDRGLFQHPGLCQLVHVYKFGRLID